MNDEDHEKYTGVSNQVTLKNLVALDQLGKKINIRFPIVPSITDTKENLLAIRGFVSYLSNLTGIDLLPYHRGGEGKYEKYGKENKMGGVESPESQGLEDIKRFFSELNCKVKIGG